MTQKEVREKVALLKDGQIVEIAGDWFQAVKVDDVDFEESCEVCQLDCICRGDIFNICREMESAASYWWYLKLAHRP